MLKKIMFLLILILPLLAFSCSEVITIYSRIVNIDSDEVNLKLHFEFKRMKNNEVSLADRIDIFRNDTLICRLTSKTGKGISEWDFPSIPNDFQIESSIKGNEIPEILKSQNIRIVFRSWGKHPGYGSWDYYSKYSESKYRWMFDQKGNQITIIDCYYEPWIGKDIIKIESTKNFQVIDSNFELKNANGDLVGFKVKYKKNPTDKVALVLDQSVKSGGILNLNFQIDSTKAYKETIIVPNKSSIGIAGKYRDL
jgi:hypothetical protein